MKEKIKFQMGSRIFFNQYPDFESKDNDILYIMTGWDVKAAVLNFHKDGKDCFFIKDAPKKVLIKETLESNVPMRACKFLVPEFNKYIGLTIEDFKQFGQMFDKIDEKHKYAKLIYDYYIENGSFTLTDEQRLTAYEDYKRTRNKNK